MKTINKKIALLIIISGLAAVVESCSTYTVRAEQAPKTDDIRSQCVVSWLWGLQDPQISAPCDGQGVEFVSVQTNWVYSLCTVATLGIVSPAVVKYRCSGLPVIEGDPIGADLPEETK